MQKSLPQSKIRFLYAINETKKLHDNDQLCCRWNQHPYNFHATVRLGDAKTQKLQAAISQLSKLSKSIYSLHLLIQ